MAITKIRNIKGNYRYEYVSKSESKEILREINKRFSINYDFYDNGFIFIKSRDKLWIVKQEVLKNDLSKIKLEGIGIVFARITKKGIKLTTNIVQVFGEYFKKNVFEINKEEKDKYIKGMDIKKELNTTDGYIIIKYKSHYIGIGLYNSKTNVIKNMIPKARRIKKL